MIARERRAGAAQAAAPAAAVAPPAPAHRGEGHPLEGGVRGRMERALGHSFANVRIHDDHDAADASRELGARAYTVGDRIGFAAGEYRPGTFGGDALLAHELAHTVQQGGDRAPAAIAREPSTHGEADADRAAAVAVAHLHAGRGRAGAAGAALRPGGGTRLQRCASDKARLPDADPRDQRAGTSLPDPATRTWLRDTLGMPKANLSGPSNATATSPDATEPGKAPAQIVVDWDGLPSTTRTQQEADTNQQALRAAIVGALDAELATRTQAAAAQVTSLSPAFAEGPARAAQQAVDKHFAGWVRVAARSTPPPKTPPMLTAGQDLFDIADPAARAAAGIPINVATLAADLSQSVAGAAMKAHAFELRRSQEEFAFFKDVINTYAADPAHQQALAKLEQRSGNMTSNRHVFLALLAPASAKLGSDSAHQLTPLGRSIKWELFKGVVHEYIHTLAHPAFEHAVAGRQIPHEGFTEMFTKEVLEEVLPMAANDFALRTAVEGDDYVADDEQRLAAERKIIGTYATPQEYVANLAAAEQIRARLGSGAPVGGGACSRPHIPPGGYDAVKAAYFQGHVEFLGLDPEGGEGPIGVVGLVTVPDGVRSVPELAIASGVPAREIASANHIAETAPLVPGAQITVPGARDHIVVVAAPDGASVPETRENIARMHGVKPELLDRANPTLRGAGWSSLTAGRRILIPRH